jgi:uncharacterized protein
MIEFSVGNYRSFKDVVTFSMVAAPTQQTQRDRLVHTLELRSEKIKQMRSIYEFLVMPAAMMIQLEELEEQLLRGESELSELESEINEIEQPIQNEGGAIDRNNVFAIAKDINLLKSAAIYGANASGKSNLVRAIFFMKSFVINSAIGRRVQDPIDTDIYRLSKDTEAEPSYFEIIFASGKTRYRYGFEVDRRSVKSEWLYQTLSTEEAELFSREEQDINVSENFPEGQELIKRTRSDALFLSVVTQFNGDIATDITRWFYILDIISDVEDEFFWKGLSDKILTGDYNGKQHLIDLVKNLNLGIENIKSSQPPIDTEDSLFKHEVQATHYKYDTNYNKLSLEHFDLGEESAGTQKLYRLSGLLISKLEQGGTLIVDELDARLHPLITSAIVKLFNSPKTNPNNAQLIFTTHDTNLLSSNLFRKDQIWFTEKNRYGATDLYSLAEYKIPEQSSFEQDYIAGKYGAVPFIGDLSRLLGK